MEIAVPAPTRGFVREIRCTGAVRCSRPGAGHHGGHRRVSVSLDIANLARLYAAGAQLRKRSCARCMRASARKAIRRFGSRCSTRRPPSTKARTAPRWLPLYGIPFAVKDNIDVAGLPTTAACPAFAYVPRRSAHRVERLHRRRRDARSARPISISSPPAWSARVRPMACRAARSIRDYISGRIELRLGGGGGRRARLLRARHRHGGFGPRAGRVQQHRRAQADQGADQHAGCRAGVPNPGHGLDPCVDGGGCRANRGHRDWLRR